MANRKDTTAVNHSHLNEFAQVVERIGLAIIGALCGFYVAALVARANIEAINSVGVLCSVVLCGSIGFYLGTNIPSLPSGAARRAPSESGSAPRTNPIALASATVAQFPRPRELQIGLRAAAD